MKTTDYRIATINEGSDFRAISIYRVPHVNAQEAVFALQEHLGHPDVHYVVDTTGDQTPNFEAEVQFIADALNRNELSIFDKIVVEDSEEMEFLEGNEDECECDCIFCDIRRAIEGVLEETVEEADPQEDVETIKVSFGWEPVEEPTPIETQATREDVISQIFNIASNNTQFGLTFFPYIDSLCAKDQSNSLDYILHSKYYHTIVATALNLLDNQSQSVHGEATFV